MPFPFALKPTSRDFEPGDYPVKPFRTQNGSEIRILYGSQRTNMKLALTYSNIADSDAQLFLDHYDETKGTFATFAVVSASDVSGSVKTGWEGNPQALGAGIAGSIYRYEKAPAVTQVRPGISTVTVNLIGVQ